MSYVKSNPGLLCSFNYTVSPIDSSNLILSNACKKINKSHSNFNQLFQNLRKLKTHIRYQKMMMQTNSLDPLKLSIVLYRLIKIFLPAFASK